MQGIEQWQMESNQTKKIEKIAGMEDKWKEKE